MSVFDGMSRPMRAAGLGLLGVAVIAVVIGGVSLLTGDGDDEDPTAASTTSESAPGNGTDRQSPPATDTGPGAGSPTDAPDGDGRNGTDGAGDNGANGTDGTDGADGSDGDNRGNGEDGVDGRDGSADGVDGSADGTGPNGTDGRHGAGAHDQKASVQSVGVRVYNNSTITGLAHNAAGDFRNQGWDVVEVGNYSSGVIPTTTAYFRPGTQEEAAAHTLAQQFGMRVEPRFDGIKDSTGGVIVIATQDYAGGQQSR